VFLPPDNKSRVKKNVIPPYNNQGHQECKNRRTPMKPILTVEFKATQNGQDIYEESVATISLMR
jgi:hypothetical protein